MNRQTIIAFVCMMIIMLMLSSCCQEKVRYSEQEQANIEFCYQFHAEGINKQNPDYLDGKLTDDWVRHCESMPDGMRLLKGIDKMKGFLSAHFAAFPDWNEEITMIKADSNFVCYMTTGTGTHTGAMSMLPVITNKSVSIQTFIIQRFEGNQIAESWVGWDNVAFLEQLGLFPPPPPPEG